LHGGDSLKYDVSLRDFSRFFDFHALEDRLANLSLSLPHCRELTDKGLNGSSSPGSDCNDPQIFCRRLSMCIDVDENEKQDEELQFIDTSLDSPDHYL
jgi:hypothetical protein